MSCFLDAIKCIPTPATATLRQRVASARPWHCRRITSQVLQAQQQSDYYSGNSSSSNLGVLQRVIEQDPMPDDPYGMQRVSVDSFSSRGFYLEGSSLVSSLLLLVLLLALTFQRILGLDRFINKALQDWRDNRVLQKRADIVKAKESLEDLWDKDSSQQ